MQTKVDRRTIVTAGYTTLAFFALAGLFALLSSLGRALSVRLGFEPLPLQLVSAAVLAFCIPPVHRLIRRRLNERLLGRGDELGGHIVDLLQQLDGGNRNAAVMDLAQKIDRVVMPAWSLAYAVGTKGFTLIHNRALPGAVQQVLANDADLLRFIDGHRNAFSLTREEVLQAEVIGPDGPWHVKPAVVLPIREGERLDAFICLGEKGSGDDYDDGDIHLLGAAAAHLSNRLTRFSLQRRQKPVFLSYASEDRDSATEICRLLEERQIKVWMKPRDIIPERDHAEQVIQAIELAEIVVVVLSGSANVSIDVRNEAERACSRRKTIIPFCIQNVEPSRALELYVSRLHRLDAWRPPLRPRVEDLATTIRTISAAGLLGGK